MNIANSYKWKIGNFPKVLDKYASLTTLNSRREEIGYNMVMHKLHTTRISPLKKGKIKSIQLGVEWEFWGRPKIGVNTQKYCKEYYNNMWEVNKFRSGNLHTEEDIFNYFTSVLENMKHRKKDFRNFNMSSTPLKIDDANMVWNGLHIHLSVNETSYARVLDLYNTFVDTNIITNWKIKNLPTLRAIWSHHIWGRYRQYNYNYKRKKRHSPLVLTKWGTMEFRLFDVEDIIYKTRRRKLAKFLYELIQMYNDDKVQREPLVLNITNGESVRELAEACRQFNKNTQTFRVLEDELGQMKIQANRRTIVLNLSDNYIQIEGV